MKAHPRDFGFTHGFDVVFDAAGVPSIDNIKACAREWSDVVYVALLEDGRALKVGVSGRGALWRWSGIVKVMDTRRWPLGRPHEQNHGKKLRESCKEANFSVWIKQPIQVAIPYAAAFTDELFSARHAEEVFLDRYYDPLFGSKLGARL
jgi:hypothetical protein